MAGQQPSQGQLAMDLLLSCLGGIGRILPILCAAGQSPQFLALWAALQGSYMAAVVHHGEGKGNKTEVGGTAHHFCQVH